MSSTIEIRKICEYCGREFVARKATTRFCSKRCSEHSYKDRLRQQHVEECQTHESSKLSNKKVEEVKSLDFLTPTQAATLIGVGRATMYRYLGSGIIPAFQFKGKTVIRRSDLEHLFDEAPTYAVRGKHSGNSSPSVEEWYTTKEIIEKFGVSNSWVFEAGKKEGIPKVMKFGRTYWSKSHCDRVFAKKEADPEIIEWYTAAEMREKFCMTDSAIWNFVSKKAIPKKKEGGVTYYSKRDVDIAKRLDVPDPTAGWYTYAEAMEKYGLTHDQVCHYLKTYKIKKVKIGKFTKFSREEFDNLLAPPIL